MNADPATRLRIGATQTVLSRGGAGGASTSLALELGTASIGALWRHDQPSAHDIEHAIDVIEESLLRVPPTWRPIGTLVTSDDAIGEWALAAGAALTLPAVEALFQRLASAALGDPTAARGLPAGRDAAAALIILREVMHHLGATAVGGGS